MISVNTRASIVLLYLFIALLFFAQDIISRKKFDERSVTFMKISGFGFPLIDLKMVPSELNSKVFEILVFLFFIFSFKMFCSKIKKYPLLFIQILFFILILTGLFSDFILNSLYATLKFLSYFLFLAIVYRSFRYDANLPMYLFNLIVIYAVIFLILQLYFGLDFSLYGQLNEASINFSRYTSFSQDPQKMATIAYMIAVVYLGSLYSKDGRLDYLNIVFFGLIVWIALLTGSRSSCVGFIAAAVLLFIFKFSIRNFLILSVSACFIYFFLSDYLLSQTLFQRILDFDDDLEGRSSLFWAEALKIFYDNYLVGVGNGNFSFFMNNTIAYKISYGKGMTADQPESGYLLWLVETGLCGSIAFITLIVKILTYNNKRKNAEILKFKLAYLVWVIGFVTVYSLSDTKIVYVLVLLTALIFNTKKQKNRRVSKNMQLVIA